MKWLELFSDSINHSNRLYVEQIVVRFIHRPSVHKLMVVDGMFGMENPPNSNIPFPSV